MANESESKMAECHRLDGDSSRGWMRVSFLAVASALAGGLAAAWFYRKTLARLREAEVETTVPLGQDAGSD